MKYVLLKKSEPLSEMLGMNIYFKKEFLLPTGGMHLAIASVLKCMPCVCLGRG